MGCDIHIVLEKKINGQWIGLQEQAHRPTWTKSDEGKWERGFVRDKARERDYDAFAKLAGVRGPGPEPKGMPEDASELAMVLYREDGSDPHSHSWCSLREFFEAKVSSMSDAPAALLVGGHPAVDNPMEYWFGMYEPEGDDEYRVVFGFDN